MTLYRAKLAARMAFREVDKEPQYIEFMSNHFLMRCGAKYHEGEDQELKDQIVADCVRRFIPPEVHVTFWSWAKVKARPAATGRA